MDKSLHVDELDVTEITDDLKKIFGETNKDEIEKFQKVLIDKSDGYNFERKAIEMWFKSHDTNPQTNKKVPKSVRGNLKTNYDKKSSVEGYKEKTVKKCLKYYKKYSEEKYVDLRKKLLLRAYELKADDTEILKQLVDVYPEKKMEILFALLRALIKKKEFKEAEKYIVEEDYQNNIALLTFFIQIKDLQKADGDKLRFQLGKNYSSKKLYNESEKILGNIKTHTVESLELIILMLEKQNKEIDGKYVSSLSALYFKNKEFEKCMVIMKKIKNKKKRGEAMNVMKESFVKEKDFQKSSEICLEIEKLEQDLGKKIEILKEGYKLNPLNFNLLKNLYHLTSKFVDESLNPKIKRLESRVDKLEQENEMLRDGKQLPKFEMPQKSVETGKGKKKADVKKILNLSIHRDFICDGCRSQPIIGARYSEINNLCEECYKKGTGKGKIFKVYYQVDKASHKTNDSQKVKLKKLKEMGFYDEKACKKYLKLYKGDLYQVIKKLINLK